MTPWMLLTALVAAINLAGFIALRGRWGRIVLALGLAALVGTVAGDAIGSRIGLEPLRLGDYHIVSASVGAQLAMLVTLLLAALLPQGGDRTSTSGGRAPDESGVGERQR